MGIVLGLTAAVCWGVGDFLARFASRSIGPYRTLFYIQLIGLSALTGFLAATGGVGRIFVGPSWEPWAWGTLAGLLNTLNSLALYRSFQIGTLAVVSPIAASYPALTTALAFLSGETLGWTRGAGMVLALVGVILAATSFAPTPEGGDAPPAHRQAKLSVGVPWAVCAAIGLGLLFWLLGFRVTPVLGGFGSVWLLRLTTLTALTGFAGPARQTIRWPSGDVRWYLAGAGVFDTIAFVANNAGLKSGQVGLVTVLSSLFAAVTVLLACVFLRERLAWSQLLGIGIIFASIVLLSL